MTKPKVQFVDELPESTRAGKHDEFYATLVENKGRWSEYPTEGVKAVRKEGFDGAVRNGVLYVRYTGR